MRGYYAYVCLGSNNLIWDDSLGYVTVSGDLNLDGVYVYRDITFVYSIGDFTGTYVYSEDSAAYPSSGYLLTGDIVGWFELVEE